MKYKAVVFDLFGTLVDNFPRQSNLNMLTEMATILSLPKEDFVNLWTNTFSLRATGALPTSEANIEYVAEKIGLPVTKEAIKQATRVRFEFTRKTLVPRTHSLEMLSQLKKAGCKTGLISDCSVEAPVVWKSTPFTTLIDFPVFSCEVGVKKPDQKIFLLALEKLNTQPQDCLYVGDGSSKELSGALKVGMNPVLIRVPYETSEDAYRIDEEEWHGTTITSLKEVLDLVK
jgi:putative hydrolase of the HAD superfamily